MNFQKIILFGLTVACFLYFPGLTLAGFGISPPTVLNKSLLPGSSYEQIIYIVQSEPKETLSAQVKISAGEATSWISIENGNIFEVPKGIQQFPMKVLIRVPSDAEIGEYKGTIELLTSPQSGLKQSDPVKVNLGAEIGVDLEVTNNQLVDYNIQGFSIKDVSKGSPIIMAIKVQNRGNGTAGPTKIKIAFYDIFHSEKLWEGEAGIQKKAEPFSVRDINVEFPNDLEIGQYWADFEIFDGEKSVSKSKTVFTIVAPFKNQNLGNGISFNLAPFKSYFIWAGALIGILAIAGLLMFLVVKAVRGRKKIKIEVHKFSDAGDAEKTKSGR